MKNIHREQMSTWRTWLVTGKVPLPGHSPPGQPRARSLQPETVQAQELQTEAVQPVATLAWLLGHPPPTPPEGWQEVP